MRRGLGEEDGGRSSLSKLKNLRRGRSRYDEFWKESLVSAIPRTGALLEAKFRKEILPSEAR